MDTPLPKKQVSTTLVKDIHATIHRSSHVLHSQNSAMKSADIERVYRERLELAEDRLNISFSSSCKNVKGAMLQIVGHTDESND